MDWPAPSERRTAGGEPGPGYWQQRADYDIEVRLDTGSRAVTGKVTIRYTNNSPDTLRFVWLHLEQNLYRPGSAGSTIFSADSRWGVRGFQGGYDIGAVSVNGGAASIRVHDTMGRIDLPAPVAPRGGSATISVEYGFRVPEHGSDRMGRDGTLYQLAQWYPRMVVYDDVRGWNTDPYLGQGEFYLDYGDVRYAVSVPAGYVVAGSGVLQNAADVLTAQQRERLERARRSTAVVQVITAEESRPRVVNGMKTWRFLAENVRDVAWAAAPDFRWDATSWDGILTQAYYPWPKSGRAWEAGAEQTQWSIRTYSQLLSRYPYPQATSVAGPVGGMEYPMFVMVRYGNPPDDPNSIFRTLDHEHGHEWFPMIVGSNERRYAWMDEGINSYINAFSRERRDPAVNVFPSYVESWRAARDAGIDVPLMTPPDQIPSAALGAIGYRKPAAVLLALRNNVVGRDAFDAAMREYVRRWAYRHPTPADFFRTIENTTGHDLSWFWRAFVYGDDVLDIGIDGIASAGGSSDRSATIVLRRHTSIPFPVTLRLALQGGGIQDVRVPVQAWAAGSRISITVPVNATVTGARLWPDATVPDWNAGNDTWGRAPAGDPPMPSTSGGQAMPATGR